MFSISFESILAIHIFLENYTLHLDFPRFCHWFECSKSLNVFIPIISFYLIFLIPMVYPLFNIRFDKCLFYWSFESLFWGLSINSNVLLLFNILISTCHFQILVFLIILSWVNQITYFCSFCIKVKTSRLTFPSSIDLATTHKFGGIALSLLVFSKYLWF